MKEDKKKKVKELKKEVEEIFREIDNSDLFGRERRDTKIQIALAILNVVNR